MKNNIQVWNLPVGRSADRSLPKEERVQAYLKEVKQTSKLVPKVKTVHAILQAHDLLFELEELAQEFGDTPPEPLYLTVAEGDYESENID